MFWNKYVQWSVIYLFILHSRVSSVIGDIIYSGSNSVITVGTTDIRGQILVSLFTPSQTGGGFRHPRLHLLNENKIGNKQQYISAQVL